MSLPRATVRAFPHQRMAWWPAYDDTCGFMRRMLVVLVWVVATVGVTYVANAAVELVDLQVFPQGARIEVLARAQPTPTTLPPMGATTAPPVATTTVPALVTTVVAPATTVVAPATTVVVPATTVVAPVSTTTEAVAATTVVSTTTVAVVSTTAAVGALVTTTTVSPVATTRPPTTTRPPPTTTRPPATTTTAVPVSPLVVGTGSLPGARVGEAYQVVLVASGGTPPYSWSLASGTLPDGLGLSGGGVFSGVPGESSDIALVFSVSDTAGRSASSAGLVFETAADRRTVAARGGTVFVDVVGDSVSLFLASPADGFSAVIVEPGGFRVEVQFVPLQGDATSWVVCEVAGGVVCTHG
jgi:hypothetical protein